jgi:outer membrane protein assembly factor BamB
MKHNKRLLGKILLLLAILIIGGVAVSGCYGRHQPRGWSGATVVDGTLFVVSVEGRLAALNTSDGSRLWPDSVLLGTSESKTAIYGTPAVEGELVYVGGYNGKVYAITSSLGAVRWVYPREGNLEPIVGGVVASQGRVYFGCSDGKVYALDAATGDRVQQPFQTGDKIWSTPTIDGGTVYVTSLDNRLYALDTTDGSERWQFEAGGAIISTPLVYDNIVYVGSFDGHFYAVNAADGSLRWRSEVEASSWFWAKPVVYNSVIYASCLNGRVYILDAKSGHEVRGAVDLGSPISSWPVVVDDKVIIASQEGKVYSLDTTNNQINLLFDVGDDGQEIYAPLGTSDGVVYIHAQTSKQDTLYAVEAETGAAVWSPVSLSIK